MMKRSGKGVDVVIKIDMKKKRMTVNDVPVQIKWKGHHGIAKCSQWIAYQKSAEPFIGLHERLAALADKYEFDVNALHELVSLTPTIRMSHVTQRLGIPRYVAEIVFRQYYELKACYQYQSAMKKDAEYVKFLHERVPVFTAASISTVNRDRFKYTLPTDEQLTAMPLEELKNELAQCQRSRGKYKKDDLQILQDVIKERTRQQRELKKKIGKSEQEEMVELAKEEEILEEEKGTAI